MKLTSSPLTLWEPRFNPSWRRGSSTKLDPAKCHAMTSHGTRITIFSQCTNPHKTTRPFKDGEEYPVCGVHARVYDNACRRREAQDDYETKRKAFEARLKKLPIPASSHYVGNSLQISFKRIIVNIEDLETLVKKAEGK